MTTLSPHLAIRTTRSDRPVAVGSVTAISIVGDPPKRKACPPREPLPPRPAHPDASCAKQVFQLGNTRGELRLLVLAGELRERVVREPRHAPVLGRALIAALRRRAAIVATI